MKKFNNLLSIGILTLSLALSSTGCGGGSASTSREGGADATLTASNAGQVGATVAQAIKLVAPVAAVGGVKAASISSVKRAPLISILETVVPFVRNQKIDAKHSSALRTEQCPNGGDIELTSVSLPDSSLHIKADVNVNSCKLGAETLNGSMKVTFPADAINDPKHVKEFTIETPNFTYSDSATNITLTDFTLIFKDINYTGDSVTGGSVAMGGNISGTIDNTPITVVFSDFTMAFNSNLSGVTVSVSGRINTSLCLNGGINIVTNKQVFLPANANCPTDGEIVGSAGGNSVKVAIAPDSKISIYFNDNLIRTFDNCQNVEGLCKG